jgi:hypothetical protein
LEEGYEMVLDVTAIQGRMGRRDEEGNDVHLPTNLFHNDL